MTDNEQTLDEEACFRHFPAQFTRVESFRRSGGHKNCPAAQPYEELNPDRLAGAPTRQLPTQYLDLDFLLY